MDRGVGRLQSMGLQRVDTTEQLNNNKKKTEAQRGNKTCPNRKVANSKIRKSFFFFFNILTIHLILTNFIKEKLNKFH